MSSARVSFVALYIINETRGKRWDERKTWFSFTLVIVPFSVDFASMIHHECRLGLANHVKSGILLFFVIFSSCMPEVINPWRVKIVGWVLNPNKWYQSYDDGFVFEYSRWRCHIDSYRRMHQGKEEDIKTIDMLYINQGGAVEVHGW